MKSNELHSILIRMEGSLANYREGLTTGSDLLALLVELAVLVGWDMYGKIAAKETREIRRESYDDLS